MYNSFLRTSILFPVFQEEQAFGEQLSQEKGDLLVATEERRAQIKALEEDIQTLIQRSVEQEAELEKSDAFFFFFFSFVIITFINASCL